MPIEVSFPAALSESEQSDVRVLAELVTDEDGQPPLSDQALTLLRSPRVQHAVARDAAQLVGYAQRDGSSLEVLGRDAALTPLLDGFRESDVLVWSHGKRSRLAPVLAASTLR